MIRHRSYFLILIILFLISVLQMAKYTFADPLSESLVKAAHNGHTDIVRELIAKGADVNKKENAGWSFCFVLCRTEH